MSPHKQVKKIKMLGNGDRRPKDMKKIKGHKGKHMSDETSFPLKPTNGLPTCRSYL